VTPDWLAALDDWREKQMVKPSRTAVILAAVEQFIASPKAAAQNDDGPAANGP
jgi:hypothetical protein